MRVREVLEAFDRAAEKAARKREALERAAAAHAAAKTEATNAVGELEVRERLAAKAIRAHGGRLKTIEAIYQLAGMGFVDKLALRDVPWAGELEIEIDAGDEAPAPAREPEGRPAFLGHALAVAGCGCGTCRGAGGDGDGHAPELPAEAVVVGPSSLDLPLYPDGDE